MWLGIMGMGISIVCAALLIFLFRIEEKRGVRFAEPFRSSCDRVLSSSGRGLASLFSYISRDLGLTARFLYHKFLSLFLKLLEHFQIRIRVLIKSNKRSAHKNVGEISQRTKLHEIADHKASMALTPEEKQQHKDASLNG